MSLPDYRISIKGGGAGQVYLGLLVLLVGVGSFGLGRLSKIQELRPPVKLHEVFPTALPAQQEEGSALPEPTTGQFVSSKNGSRYHYPWCPGAQQIKEENKIWFGTREEAEAAGYTPAVNCEGL